MFPTVPRPNKSSLVDNIHSSLYEVVDTASVKQVVYFKGYILFLKSLKRLEAICLFLTLKLNIKRVGGKSSGPYKTNKMQLFLAKYIF